MSRAATSLTIVWLVNETGASATLTRCPRSSLRGPPRVTSSKLYAQFTIHGVPN